MWAIKLISISMLYPTYSVFCFKLAALRQIKLSEHNTNFQLKQDNIQGCAVILWIEVAVKEEIASQRGSTTLSRVAKISLWKPYLRTSFQIYSIGFISGVCGGMKNKWTFSWTRSEPALWQAASSQQRRRIMSSGISFVSASRKMFMQAVLLHWGLAFFNYFPYL